MIRDDRPDDRLAELSRWRDGELTVETAHLVEVAVATDPTTAALAGRLAALDDAIGADTTPTDLRLRVRAALPIDRRRQLWLRVAVAASLIAGVGLGLAAGRSAVTPEPPNAGTAFEHVLAPGAAWGGVNRLAAEIGDVRR